MENGLGPEGLGTPFLCQRHPQMAWLLPSKPWLQVMSSVMNKGCTNALNELLGALRASPELGKTRVIPEGGVDLRR